MTTSRLHTTQGVILHRTVFRERDQICSLFTPDVGVLKLIVKGRAKRGKAALTYSPLMRVEVSYAERRGEIHACEEIHLLQSYMNLRQTLGQLEAACSLLKAVEVSQWPGKPAPLLHQLLLFYLDKIPVVRDPTALIASFQLKILRHEGLLDLPLPGCSDIREQELAELLAWCTSFTPLAEISLPMGFKEQVDWLFQQTLKEG